MLFPYLEQANRFAHYDLEKSIYDPSNFEITSQPIDVYLCPSMTPYSESDEDLGEGSYIISFDTRYTVGNASGSHLPDEGNGAFTLMPENKNYRLSIGSITDGTSNTFFFGEIDNSVDWIFAPGVPATDDYVEARVFNWAQSYVTLARGHVDGIFNASREVSVGDFGQTTVFRSDHPGGVTFGMLDGSVHFISDTVEKDVLESLVTRSGGEIAQVP